MNMAKFVSEKIKMKSESRLAAVQATYMIAFGQLPVDEVIKDFTDGKIGRFVIDEDEVTQSETMVEVNEMDKPYFEEIVRGMHKNKENLEKSIQAYLSEGYSFERMNGTLQALLLCAMYEIIHTNDVDANVIIKEYVDLAYAFFSKKEPKMVNALLDKIAKEIRG